MVELRPYQQECIRAIEDAPAGAWMCQLATGMGKTVIFTSLPRQGKVLLLSHREELVKQPLKYFSCKTGIEMGNNHAEHDAEVVSASVATMVNRLENFAPDEFDTIIVDECHHSGAKTYKKIFSYFKPRKLIGFTATLNRSDGVRLDDVFQDIIFKRDLRWAIQQGWLCDIYCRRVNIGYDLSAVHSRGGDYAPGELEKAMDGTSDAIAEAYRTMAKGATLIFAASVAQAEEIAAKIDGAVVVTGQTRDRASIIERFTRREIPCIVNVMVFTEGTDMPLVETVIIARPTQSDALYTQMVGRGLRLHPDKDKLNLIDCVGVTGKASLCTAPTLVGVDMNTVPENKRGEVQGNLFELPTLAVQASDCPQSWIMNVKVVDLWAKQNRYNLHGVAWFKQPDGSLTLSLPKGEDGSNRKLRIPPPDELGRVELESGTVDMQYALDSAYRLLCASAGDCKPIWDITAKKRWGNAAATEKQKNLVKRFCKGFNVENLTKMQAGLILERKMAK